MRLTIAFILLVILFSLFIKFQPFLEIKGFSAEGGLGFQLLKFHFGNFSLTVADAKYRWGKGLSIGVLAAEIPNPPPSYVETVEKPNYLLLRQSIEKFLRFFNVIPFPIEVKDAYFLFGENSLNLYNLGISKGNISVRYGELFLPNNGVFILENLSLSGSNFYAIFSGKYRWNNLSGDLVLSLDPQSGKIQFSSSNSFEKKKFLLKGNLFLTKYPYGFLFIDYPFGKVKSIFHLKDFLLNVSLRGNLKFLNYSIRGLIEFFPFPHYQFEGSLRNLCGRTIEYTLIGDEKKIGLAILDIKDRGYISLNVPFKSSILALGELNGGFLKFFGKAEKWNFIVKNVNLLDFCGFSLKDFSLDAKGLKDTVRGTLNYSKINYRWFTLYKQNLKFLFSAERKFLELTGALKGTLSSYDGVFWGYLSGKLGINEKILAFNLPQIDIFRSFETTKLKLWLQKLSWDAINLRNIHIYSLVRENFLKTTLSGNAEGHILYSESKYLSNLKLWFFYGGKPYKLTLYGRGTQKEGNGKLSLEDLSFTWSYQKRFKTYYFSHKGQYKFLTFGGKVLLGTKRVEFREILQIEPNLTGITGVLNFIGEGDRNLSHLKGTILPFCLALTGEKVACFKTGEFEKNNRNIYLHLESIKNFPVYASINFRLLKFKKLFLRTLFKFRNDFINSFITSYGFYLEKPKEVVIPFEFEGDVSSLPKNLLWIYATELDLFSVYFYKPLKVYLTLQTNNGVFSSLIGLSDAFSKTIYGSASILLERGVFKADMDFSELPLRANISNFLRGYLNTALNLRVEKREKTFSVKGVVLSGGFLKVNSYKFPSSRSGGGESKNFPLRVNLEFFSSEPLYVETPDGKFTLNYRGKVVGKTVKATVEIAYGELKLLGKTFYIHGGEIDIVGNKVYLDIPMTYYAPERTIYLRIYGNLPWNNLKFEIYSTPPAPKEELLAALISGGGTAGIASNLPLAKVLLQGATMGLVGVVNKLSSSLISGVSIKFEPSFDPTAGFAIGVDIEKRFDDFATIGYHWFPSSNPKTTYLWGAMKFLYNTYLRGVRYSDGSNSLLLRFAKEFGLPF
ncbi:MAG TPA: hypothetical protein EYO62_06045 [Aquificales bacterium]|nr:hypothetical protein [Aquificales bacterium]